MKICAFVRCRAACVCFMCCPSPYCSRWSDAGAPTCSSGPATKAEKGSAARSQRAIWEAFRLFVCTIIVNGAWWLLPTFTRGVFVVWGFFLCVCVCDLICFLLIFKDLQEACLVSVLSLFGPFFKNFTLIFNKKCHLSLSLFLPDFLLVNF